MWQLFVVDGWCFELFQFDVFVYCEVDVDGGDDEDYQYWVDDDILGVEYGDIGEY